MNKLTAEMKAELAKKRMEADANARIREGNNNTPSVSQPDKPVKILPEAPIDYYEGMNRVSKRYDVEPRIYYF